MGEEEEGETSLMEELVVEAEATVQIVATVAETKVVSKSSPPSPGTFSGLQPLDIEM